MTLLVKILTVCLALTLVQSRSQRDRQFFLEKSADEENEALLVMTWVERGKKVSSKCELFVDDDLIKEVLSSTNPPIKRVSENEMENLLDDCSQIVLVKNRPEDEEDEEPKTEDEANERTEYAKRSYREKRASSDSRRASNKIQTTTDSSSTTAGYDGIPVIFPGTKWCGAGDRAKHYDDLGLHQDTDRCCRAHDLCNDTLAPGETRNNLTNNSPFTKLSCQCDNDFYDCLSRVNSVTSNTIGNMYFNILKRECYEEDYPLTKKCKKWRTFLKITCKEYERDTKSKKVAQWVPAKKYKKIPFPGPITVTLPF